MVVTGVGDCGASTPPGTVFPASGRPVGWQKSVVGEGVFTHESGIHVDGLLKHPDNYQGFDPRLVGRETRFVVGKHSGTQGVRAVYALLGETLAEGEASRLLAEIREFVLAVKRSPESGELLGFLGSIRARRLAGKARPLAN